MAGDADLYRRYTSTSVLPEGTDARALLAWTRGYFTAHLAPLLPPDRAATIAEIGCGWGRYLVALGDAGYRRVEGVDVSEEQVAYARGVLQLSNVTHGDALPWLDARPATFDCILALDVLEHLELGTLVDMMHAVRRALRPRGRLLVHVPNALAPLSPLRHADLTHRRAFTSGSLTQLFRTGGLTPVLFREARPHGRGPAGMVRRLLWKTMLRPAIHGWMLAANGDAMGGVYTANLIAVAERT
jgi:SAM-dependent methyltransferase